MTLEQLRLKHPRLVYKRFDIEQTDVAITISHEFLLEPDIVFRPTVTIPRLPAADRRDGRQAYSGKIDEAVLAPYAFNLGMVEAISYWKAACPKEFVVEAGILTKDQIRFWYDLFLHGLGEFFYRNEIDFTQAGFLEIKNSVGSESHNTFFEEARQTKVSTLGSIPSSLGEAPTYQVFKKSNEHDERGFNASQNGYASPSDTHLYSGQDLILVGGGKDSAVTLGIMKESDRTLQTMILNPTKAVLDSIRVSGFPDPIVVNRVIDPKLFELNTSGYLNGHTPFSAYLAFLGVTVAALYGNENVIVSNERSANEGNVMYHGMEINHQYSKSFRFETMVRAYFAEMFEGAANYFSFLRPLNDLQIGKLFSRYPQYFPTFRSCNVGSKTNIWCGSCPKCAFTFLMLFAFIPYQTMLAIFGSDYFRDPRVIEHIHALVGLTPVKPFECVGTRDEARLAVVLAVEKYLEEHNEIPEGLFKIKSDLDLSDADIMTLKETVIEKWGDTYNLPPEHLAILRSAYE